MGRLLVIGLPESAVSRVAAAVTRRDVELVVFDQSLGQDRVDGIGKVFRVDHSDPAACLLEALRLHRQAHIDAVLTLTETAVPSCAAVADALDVPGNSYATGLTLRWKHRMREVWSSAGLRQPTSIQVTSVEQAIAAANRMGFPCIVKPADGFGSRGVVLIETLATVPGAFDQAYRSGFGRGLVLVEEYIEGPEFSVESIVEEGRVFVVAITEKTLGPLPQFIEIGHLVPAAVNPMVRKRMLATLEAAHTAVGFNYGVTHTEIRLSSEEPVLIEMAGRPGGDKITTLVEMVFGIEMISAGADAVMGRFTPPAKLTARGAAGIRFLTAAPGCVTAVEGVDRVRDLPGVFAVEVGVQPGDLLGPVRTEKDRVGYVIASGGDRCEACERLTSACDLVRVNTATTAVGTKELI